MAKKIKGLGDVVKTVTDAVGMEQCPKCKQNQSWLNVNFAFNKPRPLTEEEKTILKKQPTEVDLIKIYNSAFNQEIESPEINVLKAIIKKLNQLLNYEN